MPPPGLLRNGAALGTHLSDAIGPLPANPASTAPQSIVIKAGIAKLSSVELKFLAHIRIAHLATADSRAVPHIVPVCFVVAESTLYITIDDKPKRDSGVKLKRLRNITENPAVAVVVDRYDEDWTLLGWVMLHGRAEVLRDGLEHQSAQAMLRSRYPQLKAMQISLRPVIAVRIERAISWGNLSVKKG